MDWTTLAAWLDAPHAELARQVVQRGTAAIFAVAFLSTLLQFPALLGERGLLPATRVVDSGMLEGQPTLFRWGYSDRLLRILCLVSLAIALALVAGLPQLGPAWVPMLAFLALWIAYLSILSVGQVFYGFGWEMLLCEAGFLVAFLGSNATAPPALTILLLVWLVFRLEFGAGMIKIRGGREWRDLTALTFHHETQPMPGPLSRTAHLLPRWFHKGEVLGNHVAQLAVPWLLFAIVIPHPVAGAIASAAAAVVILTQLWLVVTGNFAWLNWITIVLAFAAVDDRAAAWLVPALPTTHAYEPTPLWWSIPVAVVFLAYAWLSIPAVRNLASRRQLMNASFNRLRLANAYGAFGTVTKVRDEIVIEGTLADDPTSIPDLDALHDPASLDGEAAAAVDDAERGTDGADASGRPERARGGPGADASPAAARARHVSEADASPAAARARHVSEADASAPAERARHGWVEYGFKGKPGDVRRVPGWFAPYHLRLDWLMWFLALGSHGPWFRALLVRLLEADPATLRLLGHDPFDGQRPTWVRARVYRYRFATHRERRETGQVWMREPRGLLVPPLRLPPATP